MARSVTAAAISMVMVVLPTSVGKWIVGRPGETCDSSCAELGGCERNENAWHLSRKQFKAIVHETGHVCKDFSSGGSDYDPSESDGHCAWESAAFASGVDPCEAKPSRKTIRFCPCCRDTVRLMAIGDSITLGAKVLFTPYRLFLDRLLTERNYKLEWLGRQHADCNGYSKIVRSSDMSDSEDFAKDYLLNWSLPVEACCGFTISDMMLGDRAQHCPSCDIKRPCGGIREALSGRHSPDPDLILLMLGTNNLVDDSPVDAVRKLAKFVRMVLSKKPMAALFVSTLMPSPKPDIKDSIVAFNKDVEANYSRWVPDAFAAGMLHLVDCSRVTQFVGDDLHPTSRGSLQCAEAFSSSIHAFLQNHSYVRSTRAHTKMCMRQVGTSMRFPDRHLSQGRDLLRI